MQEVSLDNFTNDIGNVKEYIKHIDLVNSIVSEHEKSEIKSLKEFNEHLHKFGTEKKLFEYKSITISLYGVLEKHIGLWVLEHVDALERIISHYENIPAFIKTSHFDLSIRLISLINEGRHSKYDSFVKEDILTNLSGCLNNPSSYKMNNDAFTPMSGNLKHSKIVDAFKPLDIDLGVKLKSNSEFYAFLKRKYGSSTSNKGDELFRIIDELVSRRNDIAHGGYIDDIINLAEFDVFIDYMERYGKAIFQVLQEKEIEYESLFLYTQIENIKGVFQKGTILCFEIENTMINIGDFIILKTPLGNFIKKEILEIQMDNKQCNNLVITEKMDVGVNLGEGITKNQIFYIKKT
jgi:hypothetical protein